LQYEAYKSKRGLHGKSSVNSEKQLQLEPLLFTKPGTVNFEFAQLLNQKLLLTFQIVNTENSIALNNKYSYYSIMK
jgi:hypothetical protein